MFQDWPFYSPEHEAAFFAARDRHAAGGPEARICGARTRTGKACENIPLKGHHRCLMHCGVRAAREYRERQRQEFLSGKLSAEEWHRAEAKRAANRLQYRWRKDPWLPGATIDLGAHEAAFQDALRRHSVDPDGLPPAVADWLRWRFRRYQIDRQDGSKWADVMSARLPERLRKAGPGPRSGTSETRGPIPDPVFTPPFKALPAEAPDNWTSKRHRPDMPKGPTKVRGRKQLGPGRPRKDGNMGDRERDELSAFAFQHRDTLGPLFEHCTGESDRVGVIRALRNMVQQPRDAGLRAHWAGILRKLGAV